MVDLWIIFELLEVGFGGMLRLGKRTARIIQGGVCEVPKIACSTPGA